MQENWLECARSYVGVPFVHQGRDRTGLDCLGLLLCVGHDIGYLQPKAFETLARIQDYQRYPDVRRLREGLDTWLTPAESSIVQAGDIILCRIEGRAQHLGIVGAYGADDALTLIHAYAPLQKVVEHRLDKRWRERITAIYRWRNTG
jgi:cell wall-associated NlpC family hydrolase